MKKQLIILFSFILSSAIAQTTHQVLVGPGMTYSPSELSIDVGDQVSFYLEGGYHDVNFDINTLTGVSFGNPAEINSLPVQSSPGLMGTITFDVPGTYNYDCSIYGHASMGMIGSISVSPIPDCIDDDATVESLFPGGMSISTCSAAIDYLANNYGYSTSQSCSWDGSPGFNFGGMTLADYCECSCENTMFIDKIESNLEDESYLFTLDVFGRKISKNGPVAIVFDFYSSGKVVKRVRAE